jgi:Skp family chaperone for outer membrane proteins
MMMKSLFRRIVAPLLLISLMGGSAYAQGRIATVELRKVFDGYWKTKQADAALRERAAEIEKDHKTMLDDWKKAKDEYQTLLGDASNQTLSFEEREKRKKSAEDKLKQIKDSEEAITQYERQARTTLDEQRKRMRDSIVEEIRAAVSSKAKSAGYGLVVDAGAESGNGNAAAGTPGTPVFLYVNNENDITEAVLSQLNAGAPAAPANTEEKPAEKKDEKKKDKK